MTRLSILRAKPNPRGKDRSTHQILPQQLAAEWIDIKNVDDVPFSLGHLHLSHLAYPNVFLQVSEVQDIASFSGLKPLAAGKVMRIHSGKPMPEYLMFDEDQLGADIHLFIGRDQFVWNNDKADTVRLTVRVGYQVVEVDSASYDANPPEGVQLVRIGNRLLAA